MTRLSHTAKDLYLSCPYKYYLYYIENYRTTLVKSPLAFGNCFDLALNAMLLGSKNYKDLFLEEWDKYKDSVIDYYKSDLNTSLLTKEELSLPENKQYYLSMKQKGIKMLESYYNEVYPKIKQVISVQDKVELVGHCEDDLHTADMITGVIDLIAIIEKDNVLHHVIADNKSTSESYPANSVNNKAQLPLYSLAKPDLNKGCYLTVNKKNFKTQIIIDVIKEERKEEVLSEFIEVLDCIENKRFEKNTKSCYSFAKQCDYYTHCHKGFFSKYIYKKEKV